MKLHLSANRDGGVSVTLTSREDPPLDVEEASARAGFAFDEWLSNLQAQGCEDDDAGLKLFEGHIVRTVEGPSFKVSYPRVRDAVCRLSRTGADEDVGPPHLGGDVPDGEWLFSRRECSWRLEAVVFRKV